jgi:hypothetical protein
MKAQYKLRGGQVVIEIEADKMNELFEGLTQLEDVFGDTTCGMCGKSNLQYTTRIVDENKFFEHKCKDCGGRLEYHQHKKGGGMYTIRYSLDGDKKIYDNKNRGWKPPYRKPAEGKK